jgi:hypothetical protein
MPFPSSGTYTFDVRDTADFTALSIDPAKPYELGPGLWRNKPHINVALSWAMQNGGSEKTVNHLFGHFEKPPLPNWVEYIGPDETSTQDTTSVKFRDALLRLTAGTRMFNPRTEEIIKVKVIGTVADTAETLIRNYGRGSATDYLLTGDLLLILPPSLAQGFTVGKGQTGSKEFKQFATGIVDWPVDLTNTEAAEFDVTGDPFQMALDDAWMQAKHQLESDLLFGAKTTLTDSGDTEPSHTSEGLTNYISTNVWIASYNFSWQDFKDALMEWQMIAKTPGVLMTSKAVIYWLASLKEGSVRTSQEDLGIGTKVQYVITPDGEYPLLEVEAMNEHPLLAGTIVGVPNGHIKYRPLIGHDNLEISYLPRNNDDVMRKQGHIYGEAGWEFMLEETFLLVKNIRF